MCSSDQDMNLWILTLNTVASLQSAPPLPAATASAATHFMRPVLPESKTKLSPSDQLDAFVARLLTLRQQLAAMTSDPVGSATSRRVVRSSLTAYELERYDYLEFEVRRYETYVALLELHLKGLKVTDSNATEPIPTEILAQDSSASNVPDQKRPVISSDASRESRSLDPVQSGASLKSKKISDRSVSLPRTDTTERNTSMAPQASTLAHSVTSLDQPTDDATQLPLVPPSSLILGGMHPSASTQSLKNAEGAICDTPASSSASNQKQKRSKEPGHFRKGLSSYNRALTAAWVFDEDLGASTWV
jgi:hypothetical protein